jgi:hypothetical protein
VKNNRTLFKFGDRRPCRLCHLCARADGHKSPICPVRTSRRMMLHPGLKEWLELIYGCHPGELSVSTRCSNKLCVRHLYTKTSAELMASVPRHWASGEDSHLARTTAKTVLQLRKLYAKGDLTQAMLAERLGLSLSNVKSILGRRSWKHI